MSDFSSEDAFINYVEMFKDRSIKDFNVSVVKGDKILTLSTCHDTGAKYRLVIHAVKKSA